MESITRQHMLYVTNLPDQAVVLNLGKPAVATLGYIFLRRSQLTAPQLHNSSMHQSVRECMRAEIDKFHAI